MNIQSLLNAYSAIYLRVNSDGKVSAYNGYTFIDLPNVAVYVKALTIDVPQMKAAPIDTPTVDESISAVGYEVAYPDPYCGD